jgi:dTDP-glucose 4,6-dehydratase
VNIGGDEETSMLELARRVLALTGSASAIEFVELPEDDPRVRRPDTTRAAELLGWRPRVPVEVGLKRTLEWFAEQPR